MKLIEEHDNLGAKCVQIGDERIVLAAEAFKARHNIMLAGQNNLVIRICSERPFGLVEIWRYFDPGEQVDGQVAIQGHNR
jgi:hypothetical protein